MAQAPPVISSPRLRTWVVAAAMLGLLVGSLALAWGLTGAPVLPPGPPAENRVAIDDASIGLPGAWVLDTAASRPVGNAPIWEFGNSASPAERLRVVRLRTEQELDPLQAMGQVIPQLIAGRRFIVTTDTPAPWRGEVQDVEAGDLVEMRFSTQRWTQTSTSPQLHAVALFTPDRHNFWVFQLTDQVPAEQWARKLEDGHREQLRKLIETVEFPRPAE